MAAREQRLKVSGKPSQYDNLQAFIDEQEIMRGLVQASRLPSFEIDISDNNVARATENIADWMTETGALWMN